MKKSQIYLLCIVFFFIAAAGIIYRYSQQQKAAENKEYSILPRKNADTSSAEWREMKLKAETLQANINNNPTDHKSKLGLAALFIQEARNTGNYPYYDVAAMKTVNDVLSLDSNNFEALVYKALIYLSQHHFADGLITAEKAKSINPHNAYVYGLMVDGYVEMGKYDSAVACADQMVSIRPDLSSYSRLSYLREIFGDYPGAVAAMKMAVDAGGAGDENTEWARTQMAALLEKLGDYKNASALYTISLNLRPGYAFALAGLGRVAMAEKDYPRAIASFEKADSMLVGTAVRTELADAYALAGNAAKAKALQEAIIKELSEDAKAGMENDNMGHYADRELAYAYLKINETDKALEHALLEYNRRPDNIDVNETVAWVYYKKGDYKNALSYINTALKTHSKNPVLLGRAALIFYKSGNETMARSMLMGTAGNLASIDMALNEETKIVNL